MATRLAWIEKISLKIIFSIILVAIIYILFEVVSSLRSFLRKKKAKKELIRKHYKLLDKTKREIDALLQEGYKNYLENFENKTCEEGLFEADNIEFTIDDLWGFLEEQAKILGFTCSQLLIMLLSKEMAKSKEIQEFMNPEYVLKEKLKQEAKEAKEE